MKVVEVADTKGSSIHKLIADLGPKGIMALMGAIAISWFLISGNPASGMFSGQSPGESIELDPREDTVGRLFDSIEGVELDQVLLGTEIVHDSQSTLFAGRTGTEREVVRSVVILYEGVILQPHEVTLAISTLLNVDYHRIELLNLANLGGN